MILCNFISLQAFTISMENLLRFEIWKLTEVKFAPKCVWLRLNSREPLIVKLPYIEVKFYPEVNSQTGLSSLRVSCKRAHRVKLILLLELNVSFWEGILMRVSCKRAHRVKLILLLELNVSFWEGILMKVI